MRIEIYLSKHLLHVNNHQGLLGQSLGKLELTLQNLKDYRLKCNIEKLLLGKTEIEYLSFLGDSEWDQTGK